MESSINSTLDRFLKIECNVGVKQLLQDALEDEELRWKEFNFNIFNVTIDKSAGLVTVEDAVLMVEEGAKTLSIQHFADVIARGSV